MLRLHYNPSVTALPCQLPAGNPVAALAVHRTAIHYRDCASLTLYTREAFGAVQALQVYLTERSHYATVNSTVTGFSPWAETVSFAVPLSPVVRI